MKKLAVMVAAILLAACAGLASAQTPTVTKVMVNTADEKRPLIFIDQEPIIVRGRGSVTITWEIGADKSSSTYRFPDDGVEFDGAAGKDQFIKCFPIKDRRAFQCTDKNTLSGPFKYTIRLVRSGTTDGPPPLDPTVMND